TAAPRHASDASLPRHEVLGLRVVAHDGERALLGLEQVALADGHADAFRAKQLEHLGVVLQVGAGGVAPRVPPAPVLLAEQAGERGAVLAGEAPLLPDAAVPVPG